MFVTVAICTWNRSKLLDQTLARLAGLRIPPGVEWELLVVNNNCTDDTDAVIERHRAAGALPVRRLYEANPGQSHARNCAIRAARGELLIWTDDDVLVAPEWLAAYCEAAGANPDATYWGGPIRPWFENVPPAWLPALLGHCKHLWAVLDLGRAPRPLRSGESPFGANMAIKTAVQRNALFDPRKGHVAGGFAGGDETSLIADLQAAGHTGFWVPGAIVEHFIPTARMTLDYVRSRGQQYGYQNHDPITDVNAKRLFGLPGYVVSQYGKAVVLKHLYPLVSLRCWAIAEYQSARWKGVVQRIREYRRSQTQGATPG
jgi:glucosyl-dolichyl phosphate glucuronosyltransferase